MRFAIAKLWRAFRRLPEWTVERGSIFHGIRKDRQVVITRVVERGSDGPDHSIDHAARRNDVRATFGMRDGDLCQHIQRRVIQNIPFWQTRLKMFASVENAAV